MANLRLNTQSDDSRLLNLESFEDQDLENQDPETPEEEMPPPWRGDLPACKPKITTSIFDFAPAEDREALSNLQRSSESVSAELQRTVLQFQVRELHRQVNHCINQRGSEDYWLYSVIQPVLELARELSGRKDMVLAIPLKTVTISPPSLLPKWDGTTVSRKVDFGLAIKLNDDINHRIKNLPDLENKEGGIGPASTETILRTHPLFCHIEAKKQHQAIDPIVQLGIWTSAVYTRWEQVNKILQGSSSRNFPVSFGWTVEGCYWHLHLIRRLPDGSRRITINSRVYDTRSLLDIYLVIATLYHLIQYGHKEFREQFLDSTLHIRAS